MFSGITEICNHSFLTRLISPSSAVLDLGCNYGEFAHAMIQRFGCKVTSVEPVRQLYDNIEPHSLLELLPLAVGGKNQTIEVNIFSDRCASVLGPIAANEQATTQAVEMVTLTELMRRTHLHRVDLVKMDIEGAEIDLFNRSSDEELQSLMQITVEFHDFIYPEQSPSVAAIRKRMESIGFWVLPFSLDNTNVLFVNRKTGVGPIEVAYLRSIVKYSNGAIRRLGRVFAKRTPREVAHT